MGCRGGWAILRGSGRWSDLLMARSWVKVFRLRGKDVFVIGKAINHFLAAAISFNRVRNRLFHRGDTLLKNSRGEDLFLMDSCNEIKTPLARCRVICEIFEASCVVPYTLLMGVINIELNATWSTLTCTVLQVRLVTFAGLRSFLGRHSAREGEGK